MYWSLEFSLPSGIGLYRCPFKDLHGATLSYGGSHRAITAVNRSFSNFSVSQIRVLFAQQVSAYYGSPWLTLDVPSKDPQCLCTPMSAFQSEKTECTPVCEDDLDFLLNCNGQFSGASLVPDCVHDQAHSCQEVHQNAHKSKVSLDKLRQIMDDNDPIIDYRCERCEDCTTCKSSPVLKSASMRDRMEQKLIDESVRISFIHF